MLEARMMLDSPIVACIMEEAGLKSCSLTRGRFFKEGPFFSTGLVGLTSGTV